LVLHFLKRKNCYSALLLSGEDVVFTL